MKIRVPCTQSGVTVYVTLIEREDGTTWNESGLETFVGANWTMYDVAVTERGTSKVYEADVPTGLPSGYYDVIAYVQMGGSPAMTDPLCGSAELDYPGEASSASGDVLGTMTGSEFYAYVLRRGLLRDDMETEVYDCLTDTVMEIEQLHDFDERQKETTITDTIATLGDYRMELEDDAGILKDVVLVDGNFSRKLDQISKAQFDELYPAPATEDENGRPRHWSVFAGAIQLGPRPDSTSYTYRLVYSRRITTTLTALTAIPFSAQYRAVLKDGVLWRIYSELKNNEEADRYAVKYASGIARIIEHSQNNQYGGGTVEYHGV